MKRYSNLYPQIASLGNCYLAHQKAQKRKAHYSEIKRVNRHPDAYMEHLHALLVKKMYTTSEYSVQIRNDTGKERLIYTLPYYPDRVVHHCIMNVLEPIWQKGFIRDTYSAIKGRGVHDGVKRVQKFLQDREATRFCLKMDIQKFYPSISHEIMKKIIRHKIKCRSTLALLDEIVDSAPGVPIGNYLSQYLGNLYLSSLDHWLKHDLRVRCYARYCDDMVILFRDKACLHELRKKIADYLWTRLDLRLKPNWQVFPVAVRGIDFLGYRFFGPYTLIRKGIATRFRRCMRDIARSPSQTSLNQAMSYCGWFSYADARHLWSQNVTGRVRGNVRRLCKRQHIHDALQHV